MSKKESQSVLTSVASIWCVPLPRDLLNYGTLEEGSIIAVNYLVITKTL